MYTVLDIVRENLIVKYSFYFFCIGGVGLEER